MSVTNSLGMKVEGDHIWSMGKLRLLSAWQQNDIKSHELSVALPGVSYLSYSVRKDLYGCLKLVLKSHHCIQVWYNLCCIVNDCSVHYLEYLYLYAVSRRQLTWRIEPATRHCEIAGRCWTRQSPFLTTTWSTLLHTWN